MSREKLSFLIIDDDPGDIELLRRNIQAIADLQADSVCPSTPMNAEAFRTFTNAGIYHADTAMSQAKASGRNKVCTWDADHDSMVARS